VKLFDRSPARAEAQDLPFIIIDDLVCFPGASVPLYLNNTPAVQALDTAMAGNRQLHIAFRPRGRTGAGLVDLNPVGVLAQATQVMKLPNNSSRLLVEIRERMRLVEILSGESGPRLRAEPLVLDNSVSHPVARLMRAVSESFHRYAGLHKKLPKETVAAVNGADAPHRLVDLVAAAIPLPQEQRLRLLNEERAEPRLEELLVCLDAESELLELKTDISGRVKQRMEQNQKEHFINEQIRELNRELGKEDDDSGGHKELEARLNALPLPEEARTKAAAELRKLARLQPMTPEANIVRSWLELVAELPWGQAAPDRISLEKASAILDEDHYDLAEPKDRILDYLAVRRLKGDLKAPIICFVGPPGTGKTSLGRSLARAMDRRFIRISLGGVRDEAEIRGHRRTYVGALPGKIIQNVRKAGAANPVFLLDEIDKLANDQRGDPASALLEVLDPEQNGSFSDHYLELPYDLSQVLFVCTANNLAGIPHALRDRLEIIEIPGYSRFDKQKIAQGFIIPKQLREHGLEAARVRFTPEAVSVLIDDYTMEAGVRQLERAVAKTLRKIARDRIPDSAAPEVLPGLVGALDEEIGPERVRACLKKPRTKPDLVHESGQIGVATGMAWTEFGGTVMPVEVRVVPGRGDTILTGSLGEVMKESGRIALSLLRVMHAELGLGRDFAREFDIHIHVPEGATPKDGPSAGITLCTALASAFTGRPVRPGVAMTGELTLTGKVLAVGGIRDKVLAAHRNGLCTILLPERNRIDADELPDEVKAELELRHVASIDEVLEYMLA
jgi:ATP-dependent Lon protease